MTPARGAGAAVVLDALIFSSVWAAGVAAALSAVAAASMGVAPPLQGIALAFAGTLVVYNVDRLRDRQRDRLAFPDRTAFVERNRRWLTLLVAGAAATALVLAVQSGPAVCALCTAVLGLGLLHRRFKSFEVLKVAYVTGAWIAVVVGIPVLMSSGARWTGWVASALAGTIAANVIASEACSRIGAEDRRRIRSVLATAAACGLAGLGSALLGPPPIRPLAVVAGAEIASLLAFRPTERYGIASLDGALLVGGAAAYLIARGM